MQKTLIIGLGNPYLGDDGVGWKIVEQLHHILGDTHPDLEYDCLATGGLRLMERMEGFSRVILVDAILDTNTPPGGVRLYGLDDLRRSHTGDTHSASLQEALQVGRNLGLQLPVQIQVVGMTIQPSLEFGEGLSPPIEASIVMAMKEIMTILGTK